MTNDLKRDMERLAELLPLLPEGPYSAVDNSWETSTVYSHDGHGIVAECPIDGGVCEQTQGHLEKVKEANAEAIAILLTHLPAILARVQEPDDAVVERFYVDCEFDGHNGPLLSIALVREDGNGIHIRTTENACDPWILENVVPLMESHSAQHSAHIGLLGVGPLLMGFIGECKCPTIIADSPVDIGRFCRALSTDHNGEWASTNYPGMRFEVHNIDCYPTNLPGAVQHNAWWDAMALRAAIAAMRERT